MIHVKYTCLPLLLLHLVSWCAGSTASNRLPACPPQGTGAAFQPTSSCELDVTSVEVSRQLQLLGAAGHRLPTVQLKSSESFPAAKGRCADWDSGTMALLLFSLLHIAGFLLDSFAAAYQVLMYLQQQQPGDAVTMCMQTSKRLHVPHCVCTTSRTCCVLAFQDPRVPLSATSFWRVRTVFPTTR